MIIWFSLPPAPTGEQASWLLPPQQVQGKAMCLSCPPAPATFPSQDSLGTWPQVEKAGGRVMASSQWARSSWPGGVDMRRKGDLGWQGAQCGTRHCRSR